MMFADRSASLRHMASIESNIYGFVYFLYFRVVLASDPVATAHSPSDVFLKINCFVINIILRLVKEKIN